MFSQLEKERKFGHVCQRPILSKKAPCLREAVVEQLENKRKFSWRYVFARHSLYLLLVSLSRSF